MRECGVGQRKKIIIRTADRAANRRSDKKRLQLARSRTTLAGERETRHPNQEANATGPVPSVNTKATKNEIENSQELKVTFPCAGQEIAVYEQFDRAGPSASRALSGWAGQRTAS